MHNTVDRTKLSCYNLILAFLVVLIHTENISDFPSLADGGAFCTFVKNAEWLFSQNIAAIAVPSFFMISGILFYRDFTVDKYLQKLKSRFFSLIIPFFAWNLLRYGLFYVLGVCGITEAFFRAPAIDFSWKNLFDAVFFYKNNQGFWFMYQLILFTLLAPVIRLVVKNKWAGAAVIVGLVALYASDLAGPFLVVTLNRRFILLDCLIFYMTGAYAATHFFGIINKKNRTTKLMSAVGIIIGQGLYMLFRHESQLIFYILFLLISAVSFWYFFDLFGAKPLPRCLSGITFFVYAAHGTVLEFLRQAVTYIGDTPQIALISYILLPIVTMLLLTVISMLLKKYTAPLWKFLCGAR